MKLSRLKACLLQMSCISVTAQSATLVVLPDMFDPWMPVGTQGDGEKLVQQFLCLLLVWEGQEVIAPGC